MIEYSIIAILAIALMLTYWRKNVWRKRFKDRMLIQIASDFGNVFGKTLGESIGKEMVWQHLGKKVDQWPETID